MNNFLCPVLFYCFFALLPGCFGPRACRPKCGRYEFEYLPCLDHHDRQCKDMVTLPKPSTSWNLVYEDKREVKQVVSHVITHDSKSNLALDTVHLRRGSGFSVQVSIKELNLAPLLQPVDHASSNDNEAFRGDQSILMEYCPYPVPMKYHMSLVLHQDITTRARQNLACVDERNRKSSSAQQQQQPIRQQLPDQNIHQLKANVRCDEETGFYPSPRDACQTYSVFGKLPSLDPSGLSVVCTRPGRLTEAFGVSDKLEEFSTILVDKSVKCAELRSNCDSCTAECARKMQSYQGSHRCNITADDADNGQSPRLQYCFGCCSREECSKVCQVHYSRECQRIRCITGTIAEFVLSPVFPSTEMTSSFSCHVQPVRGYKVYDITYLVFYRGDVIGNVSLSAQKFYETKRSAKAVDVHNFLKIHHGSEVTAVPEIIEGDLVSGNLTAGYYQEIGERFSDASTTAMGAFLNLRPRRPFGASSSVWRKESCDTDVLREFNIIPETPSTSDIYRQNQQLEVVRVGPKLFRLYNKTHSHKPFIYFEIPKDESILRPLFQPTTVKDDGDLKADLVRKDREWILSIEGRLQNCPGSFEMVVYDPSYPVQPLFHYDFAVSCPTSFSISFSIPTEGPDASDKILTAEIKDSFRTIKMTIFRPPNNVTTSTYEYVPIAHERQTEVGISIFSPLVAILAVFISVLGLLLFVGFVTESGIQSHRLENMGNHSRRLMFVVCYVTFRATYSILVTFTILASLIKYMNRDSIGTIREFPDYVKAARENQTVHLERIQTFVSAEILRQNRLANETRNVCEGKLKHLQTAFEEKKEELKIQLGDERLVSRVALQYTQLMISNLTLNVNRFKQDFTLYANKSVERLMRNMVRTSAAIQSNKWLSGAKIIYDSVKSKRTSQGLETKPFSEWLGLRYEVEKLAADFSLRDFPLPNLTEFLNVEPPPTTPPPASNRFQNSPSTGGDIVLPRNQWYYHYEKKPIPNSWPKRSETGPEVPLSELISWPFLLAALVAIDVVWFVHRMTKTYSTAKTLLYGCSPYRQCRQLEERSPQLLITKSSESSARCMQFIKELNLRIMKTDFVPKIVTTVALCCAIYVTLAVSSQVLTIRSLASIGYFDAMVAPVETSYQLALTRIRTNAYRIRRFEFPFYEELVNIRTKRYQLMLDMYARLKRSTSVARDSEYCTWMKLLKPEEPCACTDVQTPKLKFDGCELKPIQPQTYHRRDFGSYNDQLSRSMSPFINAARQFVAETCHLVIVFIAVIVLVDILDSVIWMYLQRFNIVKINLESEMDQYLSNETGQ